VTDPTKRNARLAPGASVETVPTSLNRAIGRPPLQVNGNARRQDQRAPVWERPAGADAADFLLRCLKSWRRS
jgi:hypothetical protein